MSPLTLRRRSVAQPVSVDALVAVIGGTAEQVLERFVSVGEDFMGRPLISAEDAKAFYGEAMKRQADNVMLPLRYEAHQEERLRRRQEVGEAAAAAVKEAYEFPHRGGEELERYTHTIWRAQRAAWEQFDQENPEITISAFREMEKEKASHG